MPRADWFKSAFKKAANVYPHHGQLWLTAQALQSGAFAMPEDARTLIEGVFDDYTEFPAALQHGANQATGLAFAAAGQAQMNGVKVDLGYVRGAIEWCSEAKAPSRLGEASMNVVLARWEADRLVPWCTHDNLRHAWAYSTVRVAERLIAKTAEPEESARKLAVEQALQTLPGKGQWAVLLPLESTHGEWIGQAWSKKSGEEGLALQQWKYHASSGLVGVANAVI
jgi:CRISPR-associated endonuclease/helicase Cas3